MPDVSGPMREIEEDYTKEGNVGSTIEEEIDEENTATTDEDSEQISEPLSSPSSPQQGLSGINYPKRGTGLV